MAKAQTSARAAGRTRVGKAAATAANATAGTANTPQSADSSSGHPAIVAGLPVGSVARPVTIAETNDLFRRSFCSELRPNSQSTRPGLGLGSMVVTAGITGLGPDLSLVVIDAVVRQTEFPHDDDPYGEHDFGGLDIALTARPPLNVFWKIDYYARRIGGSPNYSLGSDDPTDAAQTYRVLTIMRADEY
jgi:Protein of unknown function (DUF3768)